MTEFANRGKSLEKAVKKLFESYASRGIHCQQNQPEKLHDGTIVNRHGFDFQVFYDGKFLAFDAKECQTGRWNLSNAKIHQIKALVDVHNNGGMAFFMVYFTGIKKLIKFPAVQVQKSLSEGKKSLSSSDGEVINLNFLGIK
ncbi:MAG: Holliday junction resolvase RecU [Lachnospiraceae bacterium]